MSDASLDTNSITTRTQTSSDGTSPLPQHVGTKDVTTALGTSDRNLRRLIQAGKFPKPDLRLGRMLKWKVTTIEAFLEGGAA